MIERLAVNVLAIAGTLAITWAPIVYLAHMASGNLGSVAL